MSEIWKRMFFLLVLIWSIGSIRGVGEEVSGHGVSIIAEEGVNRGSRVLGSPDNQGSICILNSKQIIYLGVSLQAEDEISVVVRGLDLSAATGSGFEICDNGIDDDGDGVIDCEDGSCLDQPDCQVLTPRSTRADEGPLLGSIVPNPNDGRFRVELGSEATQMFLLDTSGRIVRSLQLRSFEEFVEWDVRGVAPGLYRLVVTSGRERSSASVLIR
jgi:hypothetical protein